MATKKTAAAESTPVKETPGLSVAIREGMEALPDSKDAANRDATRALKEWVLTTYPALAEKVNSPTFSSTLAGQRQKLTGDTKPEKKSVMRYLAATEPNLSDLLRAKELMTTLEMDSDKLTELVDTIATFGDIAKLKKSLEALKQLAE